MPVRVTAQILTFGHVDTMTPPCICLRASPASVITRRNEMTGIITIIMGLRCLMLGTQLGTRMIVLFGEGFPVFRRWGIIARNPNPN